MARLLQQATQLSEVSTSSNSDVNILSFSASLVSGRNYALFVSYEQGASSGSVLGPIVTLKDNTGGGTSVWWAYRGAKDDTDYAAQGGFALFTAPATGSRTFDLIYRRSAAFGSVKVRNVRVVVFELGANDVFVSPADFSTSSTSYQDVATLTWTPPSTGDYLLLATGYVANSRGGARLLLTDGATVVNAQEDVSLITTVGGDSWGAIWRETALTASSKTAKIQYRSYSGTANLRQVRLLAIRLDDLYGAQTTQDDADDAGTATSYTTSQSLAATGLDTATRPTLVLAGLSISGNSTTLSVGGRLTEAGNARIATLFEADNASARNTSSALVALVSAQSGANITYNLDRISETSGVTATVRFAAIAVLETKVTSDISGSADGSSTVTGDLGGAGRLAGHVAGTSDVTGDLNGIGTLSGTSGGIATVNGRISASGALVGTADGHAVVTGDLNGDGALSGIIEGEATVTGRLGGVAGLSGTADGTSTVTGDLNGLGRLSGASAGVGTATGRLSGVGALSGTAAGTSDTTGDLNGDGALVGLAQGSSTVTGRLRSTATGDIAGTAEGTSTATGRLVGAGRLAGISEGSSDAAGGLSGLGALAGTSSGASTVEGALGALSGITGTAAGISTTNGALQGMGALAGRAEGTAAVEGDLNGIGALAGTAAGSSTATGHVADAGSLRGSAHGSSAASGALSEGRTLGEILAAWGIRNGWQPPGAAVALGKLRGRAAGGSSATGKIAGLQPKTRRPRQAAPAPTARKASPARPSPARKPQIDRLIPMPGPLSGRAIGRHVVATGAVVGIGALAGTAAGAEGASVGTLKAIAEARGTGRGQGAARGAVAAIYGDTLDDEEALAMLLAAA